MTKLEEIEAAVAQLSSADLKKLRVWLDELDERDAKAGKLDMLATKAIAEDDAGTTSQL